MKIFIDDGYTLTKTISAEKGLYPKLVVRYRPALAAKRTELAFAQGATVEKLHEKENQLLLDHLVDIAGEKLTQDNVSKLLPDLRQKCLSLILGYEGADEEADAKN
jgi:hypothetical protein